MVRRGVWGPAAALVGFLVAGAAPVVGAPQARDEPAAAPAGVSARTAQEIRFLAGLRARGYDDLARDHALALLSDKALPTADKAEVAIDAGRALVEAAAAAEPDRRIAQLGEARAPLDELIKAGGPRAPELLALRARLDLERGFAARLRADAVRVEDEKGKADAAAQARRDAQVRAARDAFASARAGYDQALGPLQAAVDTLPKFIDRDDPRRAERERVFSALVDARLQRALVDYHDARTRAADSKEKNDLLDRAIANLDELNKLRRDKLAGPAARLLQARCFEEKGDLGRAMEILDDLSSSADPALDDIRRRAAAARVGVLVRRKEYPLAVDEAGAWLDANRDLRTSEEGLGVQLELAKSLLAQRPGLESDQLKDQALRAAVERLVEVSRFASPHKAEAQSLLRANQQEVAKQATQVTGLDYDAAMSEADAAITTHDWTRAEAVLRQAIRRAELSRDRDQVNRARYFLAYVFFESNRWYEAAALADFLARRYPGAELAPRAASLGLAALTRAYNTFTRVDRAAELDQMVALAEYTTTAWPDAETADEARMTLGQIALGRGQLADAARWFEAVKGDEKSPRRLDARVKAGEAHSRQAAKLRADGKAAEADAEAALALEHLAGALKARDAAGAPATDPGRVGNAVALAELHRTSGRPAEAVAVLEPVAKAIAEAEPSEAAAPAYAQALAAIVRAHLAAGKPDLAIKEMGALEKVSPSPATLTALYFELSRALKAEIETLRKANKAQELRRTEDAYKQFLRALAGSQAGQSVDSLAWAGEAMLELGMAKDAVAALRRAIEVAGRDEAFLKRPDAKTRTLRAQLKLVAALRDAKDYANARAEARRLVERQANLLEPRVELGLTIEAEARAAADARLWTESAAHWTRLADQLRRVEGRKREMFEAYYHVALAQEGLGRKQDAIKTLKGVLFLSPSAGGPDLKAQYEQLLARLGGA